MASIFTKIINNQMPCYKVAEDENFIAFLDINPNARGHTLCIPKKEIDDYLDLDDETFKDLMYFSKKVAAAIKNVIKCKKVGLTLIGIEVPHVHVHLIPINDISAMQFIN
ncbi:MAG: HIT domain-containing protein, partial [Flavobacteriaceae bacterium]|nr:HIT domain-containing protein [Flavobacteriaceae bacterium]